MSDEKKNNKKWSFVCIVHKLILKSCKSLYPDGYINYVLSTYTSIMCIHISNILQACERTETAAVTCNVYYTAVHLLYNKIVAGLFDNYKLSR